MKLLKNSFLFFLLPLSWIACKSMPVVLESIDDTSISRVVNCEINIETKDTLWLELSFDQIVQEYRNYIKRGRFVKDCKCDTIYLFLQYSKKNDKETIWGACFDKTLVRQDKKE